jgi:hypothetical protein
MPVVPDVSFTSLPDWIPDTGCCSAWSTYSPTVQAYATGISAWTMWALTGRRYGLEALTVRPCFPWPQPPVYQTYPVYLLNPWGSDDAQTWAPAYIQDGVWHNMGCNGLFCCQASCGVILDGPVQSITSITIDGAVLTPTAYRVDERTILVRQDGSCWPRCQDMNLPAGQVKTWTVDYMRGRLIPAALLAAQGVLACEIAKACVGAPCRLPQRMQSLSRQGVTVQFVQPSAYIDRGLTNLPDVDMAIAQANPGRLQRAPIVLSRDVPRPTHTTWTSP